MLRASFFYFGIRLVFCSLLISSCVKLPGTNTGNPGNSNGTPAGSISSIYSNLLVSTMCESLKKCFPDKVNLAICSNSIKQSSQILIELNVNSIINNYDQLIQVEELKQIYVSSINGDLCLKTISNFSCNSQEITSAYNTLMPDDFSSIYLLLRSNIGCSQIFFNSPPL